MSTGQRACALAAVVLVAMAVLLWFLVPVDASGEGCGTVAGYTDSTTACDDALKGRRGLAQAAVVLGLVVGFGGWILLDRGDGEAGGASLEDVPDAGDLR